MQLAKERLKLQEDRLEARLKVLGHTRAQISAQIEGFMQKNNKEEAYFCRKKLKPTLEQIKNVQTRLIFISQQMSSLEQVEHEVEFHKAIEASNKEIMKMEAELNTEEIVLANQLQEDNVARRKELDSLLDTNEEGKLMKEIDQLEEQLDKQPTGDLQTNVISLRDSVPRSNKYLDQAFQALVSS